VADAYPFLGARCDRTVARVLLRIAAWQRSGACSSLAAKAKLLGRRILAGVAQPGR
jgi:hypothetical protein